MAALSYFIGLRLYSSSRLMQRALLPPSLLGGAILLFAGPEVLNQVPRELYSALASWPGFLINFLFAGLMLGHPPSREKLSTQGRKKILPILQQANFVWFIALGQLAVGFFTVLLVVQPLGGDPLLAHIIEIGWTGGHGSASALVAVTAEMGRRHIGDLAIFSATMGLIIGGVLGLGLTGYFRRQLLLEKESADEESSSNESTKTAQMQSPRDTEESGPLIAALALMSISVLTAYAFREGAGLIFAALHFEDAVGITHTFPLFSLSLIAALGFRLIGIQLHILPHSIFHETARLNGIVLEILILSAVASLNLSAFADNALFFTVLILAATLWSLSLPLYFAPRLLPRSRWRELALLNFGMSTGVTALGLLLVKSFRGRIDGETARIYGLAAPFSAPLIGGGLISLLLPQLTARGYLTSLAFAALAFTILSYFLALLLKRWE